MSAMNAEFFDAIEQIEKEKGIPMQYLIEKCGFSYCGVIHVDDGSSRLAYERV